jgi:hypothetical protein
MRCTCSHNAKSGCCGTMIWCDHAVWFILNNLPRFFDARYPSLAAKFGAFITWISAAGLLAVKSQITFNAYRRLIEIAVVELSAFPNDKLLAKYMDALGARQVERLFKPASFSLETNPSPSPTGSSRRRCLNMNVTPDEGTPPDESQQCSTTLPIRTTPIQWQRWAWPLQQKFQAANSERAERPSLLSCDK